MSDIGLGLNYVLPRTEFCVDVVERTEVRAADGAHFVQTVADVQVTSAAVADSAYRQSLVVDAGLLEKISLVVTLDDRGFVTAVNSEAGRDASPVVSLVGKAVSLASAVVLLGIQPFPGPTRGRASTPSLEDQWVARYPTLERLRQDLTKQSTRLLDALASDATPVAELRDLGAALDAVQSQLGSIGEARRTWIASQGTTVSTSSWKLAPSDLYLVPGASLPASLTSPRGSRSDAAAEMAKKYGVLVAISDPTRQAEPTENRPMERDHLALRRSRPVVVGVYTKEPDAGWTLDPESLLFLDVVDEFSPTDPLSVDGSWWRMKKFELSYHPDMSLKSFGVGSTPQAGATASAAGDLLGALAQARKDLGARPSAADQELARAKTQLALAQTASDQEVLAATRNRAAELAVLEQQKKLRDAAKE